MTSDTSPGEQPEAKSSATTVQAPVTADESGVTAHGEGRKTEVVDVGQGERSDAAAEAAVEAAAAAAPEAEPMPEEDFEALMAEAAAGTPGGFEPGDKVEGVVEVISLHGQEVFLDLGGRATGYILKEELLDDEGNLTVSQGDKLEGIVAGTDFNGVRIRRTVSRATGDFRAIKDALAAGLPVEGKVVGTNKGGYDVMVAGARAFCPHSQIDIVRIEDPESMVGRTFEFKILEIKGREVVVSRSQLLREEQAERAAKVREELEVGATMTGTVRSIQKFGAFVDLGGVDGLVHVSELSWGHVNDPHEAVQLGQEVQVVVLEIDEKRDRIALSMRQAQQDPYVEAASGIGVGSVVEGTVARLTNFGAFVTIAEGVDGLIHVSDLAHHHVRHPKEVLSKGDRVKVRVTEIDLDRRRIGLSLKALKDDPWDDVEARYPVDMEITGKVESVRDFGVFIEVEPGVTALLPASESGVPHGQPLTKDFKVGSEVTAKVLRVEPDAKKMALTRKDGSAADRPSGGRRGGRPGGGGRGRDRGPSGPRVWIDRDEGQDDVGSLGAALLQALGKDDDKK